MRVLLVEDDLLTANMVQVNLETRFAVTVCRDGAEGLAALESSSYDLFVFDLMLPIHAGTELVARARTLGLGTPSPDAHGSARDGAQGRGVTARRR